MAEFSEHFTPLPWRVEPGRRVEGVDGLVAIAHSRSSKPDDSTIRPVVADNNAYLLAAAPELAMSLNRLGVLFNNLHAQDRIDFGPFLDEFAEAQREAVSILDRIWARME